MDRERFDALAKLFATTKSRRAAIGALVGLGFLGQQPDALAKSGKSNGKGHGKNRNKHQRDDKGHEHHAADKDSAGDNGSGSEAAASDERVSASTKQGKSGNKSKKRQANNQKGRASSKAKQTGSDASGRAVVTSCCGTKSCNPPTKSSDRGDCNFAGQNLAGITADGSNLEKVNGRGTIFSTVTKPGSWNRVNFGHACLSGATFKSAKLVAANFNGTCLCDADLTGASYDTTTNFTDAILCRTKMKDGSVNNSGCDKGTACCPTCDAAHPCPSGKVCCDGRCVAGDCCTKADCKDPSKPICRNNICSPCTQNSQCPNGVCCNGVCCASGQQCINGTCQSGCTSSSQCTSGQVCCNNQCVNGNCCAAGDCSDQVCRTKACTGNQCQYTKQPNGQPGTNCQTQCCNGNCCTSGQVCFSDNCCTPLTKQQACADKCGTVSDGCGGTYNCGDCPKVTCQTGNCNGQNTCNYTPVTNGQPGPNCDSPNFCCNGGCCTSGQICTGNGCCTPDSKEKTCQGKCGNVINNCGQEVNCGECPIRTCQTGVCDAQSSQCKYSDQPNGQPGNNCASPRQCCDGECCETGQVCFKDECCKPISTCPTNACGTISDGCGRTVNCPACPEVTCNSTTCTDNQCVNTQQPNGGPGTKCASPRQCCEGVCCTSGQVCASAVCCTPVSKEQTCTGKCGTVLNNCGQEVNCGACPEQTCKTGTCNGQHTCDYTPVINGQPGPNCASPNFCCNGGCCTNGQVCTGAGCCTPNSKETTCQGKCGTVNNNCGQEVNCGECPAQTCKTGTCTAQNICQYTNVTNGQPGPNCASPKVCCNGACCTSGQVCSNNSCCTPISICPANACGTISDGCGGTVSCPACPTVTCNSTTCTSNQCVNTPQTNGQPGTNCPSPRQCCNGVCCASGQSCVNGTCKANCGSNPPCGDGKTCCGGTCVSGVCCELDEGCDPGSCCNGLTCTPAESGQGLPANTCQLHCQTANNCRDYFGDDDWVCVGDPKYCPDLDKCCRPKH